ncbi:MAG: hypothetical protein PHV11_06245, partial [Candidatus Bipolaricaulis sp.]|nr:hypothetical protein [Candidatus Bipolaricaulis sp.]
RNANYDVSETSPTWSSSVNSYLFCYFSEQTGTDKDPKLVVNYHKPDFTINVSETQGIVESINGSVNPMLLNISDNIQISENINIGIPGPDINLPIIIDNLNISESIGGETSTKWDYKNKKISNWDYKQKNDI